MSGKKSTGKNLFDTLVAIRPPSLSSVFDPIELQRCTDTNGYPLSRTMLAHELYVEQLLGGLNKSQKLIQDYKAIALELYPSAAAYIKMTVKAENKKKAKSDETRIKITKTYTELYEKYGYQPKNSDIAKRLKISEALVSKTLRSMGIKKYKESPTK